MDGHGIESPANKMATAQAVLSLACRLDAEVNSGRISTDIFQRRVHVLTDGEGVTIPPFDEATDQDLKDGISNLALVALYASALTTDEVLIDLFGKKYQEDSDTTRRGIRAMVSQLRNAFAHNPWRPKWIIFEHHRKTYPIELDDGSAFIFEATNLHGNPVNPRHVGGIEFWIKLLQHCERSAAQ